MARKLIICLDGSGNEIEKNESNILRLYKCLQHSETQLVYYRTGVGTLDTRANASSLFERPRLIAGLFFGTGLERIVLGAYEFLCRHYAKGDTLYFFGYSRGAYAVRVLAGFINEFGLVDPHELHLIRPVFQEYRRLTQSDATEKYARLRVFGQFFHVTHPPIRFLGLWDTVDSLLTFRLQRDTFLDSRTHASTDVNPSVQTVRQVLAIDERRRSFRHRYWTPGQEYYGNRFRRGTPKPQDVRQVWFPGTHSDVAGSLDEPEAGLSKITLVWMRAELDALGKDAPAFREQFYNRYVLGEEDEITRRMGLRISRPDPAAPLHDQLRTGWLWRLTEMLPRLKRRSRWPHLAGKPGYYIPRGQPRFIPEGDEIHPSAYERRDRLGKGYAPPNLPPRPPDRD